MLIDAIEDRSLSRLDLLPHLNVWDSPLLHKQAFPR